MVRRRGSAYRYGHELQLVSFPLPPCCDHNPQLGPLGRTGFKARRSKLLDLLCWLDGVVDQEALIRESDEEPDAGKDDSSRVAQHSGSIWECISIIKNGGKSGNMNDG